MNRTEILDEAQRVITGERQDQYGNPEDSFSMIAALWSAYLDKDISPHDVAMMMIQLKIARQKNQNKDDNLVDICGYAALAAELPISCRC